MNATEAVIVAPRPWDEPIRAEVFGTERLERHAESLAAAQRAADKPSRGKNLLPRVRENSRVLLAGYRDIADTIREKRVGFLDLRFFGYPDRSTFMWCS